MYQGYDLSSAPQLPGERRGGDDCGRRAAPCQDSAAVGPAAGGHGRDDQLQPGDTRGEGLLVRRRGPVAQPSVPHQQGAPSQDPPGVRGWEE